ncbi:MAG TPA: hypothetical protein VM364_19455 [Vicinamibacterales bacterium]|nr:hypothetical protein [Vicinamibacterales bacterium]
MKASRVAAWMFGAAVCGAWAAAAAGVSWQARAPRPQARIGVDVKLDALTADVQAQAGRLRQRLANAPAPGGLTRNPFTFTERAAPARKTARPVLAVVTQPMPVMETREPVLDLIGIAESRHEQAVVRTAMITGGHDELFMVKVGERILDRYEVVAVGVDAVELKDHQTGVTRRLVLR